MRLGFMSLAASLVLAMFPGNASALTMGEFSSVCDSYAGECSSNPFLQAYVGGALDLIAMLDEETDYLDEIYCKEPSEFFDVPEIIRYMLSNRDGYRDKNAMLLVIRYLEEMGGCTLD
ncbi:MAG: hypothetical protein QNI99_10875 [Woeseiaceae bacterium]|nr:hypothetical protein [Woeseiaceae bacterium]